MNSRLRNWPRWPLIILVAISLAVSACGGKRKHKRECGKIQHYQQDRTAPSLYVPEDLSRPETEARYTVPALGADGQTGICLSRSPQTLSAETMALVLEKDDVRSLRKQAKAEVKKRKKAQKAEQKAAKQRRRAGSDSNDIDENGSDSTATDSEQEDADQESE